jgi:hypothetical protein
MLDELLVNCDLEHLPSMRRLAIATAATDLRVLPTTKPFENADDFVDAIQNTALKPNEPIRSCTYPGMAYGFSFKAPA